MGLNTNSDLSLINIYKAIPNSDPEEIYDLYSGMIVSLPLMSSPGPSTKSLLTTLLTSASQTVKEELGADNGSQIPLRKTNAYLQPAHNLAINRQSAEASDLLRFYLTSGILSPVALDRLSKDTQTSIACLVGDVWGSVQAGMVKKGANNPLMVSSRNQLVEACPPLLEARCIVISSLCAWV